MRLFQGTRIARSARIAVGLSVLVLFCGCQVRPLGPTFDPDDTPSNLEFKRFEDSEPINPAWLEPSSTPATLGPGDVIEIDLLGGVRKRQLATVGPDGKIYFDLLPGIDVWGKSLSKVSDILSEGLSQYYTIPQVSITLRELNSRRYWILGRVAQPGVYPLSKPTTLIGAIAEARGLLFSKQTGSTEELADLLNAFVIRNNKPLPISLHKLLREGDASQNIYLKPNDFVYLPSALSTEIYVFGSVRQPRSVSFKDEISLTRAIATAQGALPNAYLSQVAIVRNALTEPSIAIVDYQAIITGRRKDIHLAPRDIVYIPNRPYQRLITYGRLVLDTFVRSAAINAGAASVSDDAGTTGVNIGIQ